ncbi:hypothetical protein NDU88_008248, partial [Pleurodeles waltl]
QCTDPSQCSKMQCTDPSQCSKMQCSAQIPSLTQMMTQTPPGPEGKPPRGPRIEEPSSARLLAEISQCSKMPCTDSSQCSKMQCTDSSQCSK